LNVRIATDSAADADITGPPAAIAEQLAGFLQQGFTAFNLQLPHPGQLETVAAEIIPAVRAAAPPPS
jgi:alkanesulfonate monooxygenase SsuD/methylene tetrahydromethanopterin reductase-like flavin-dependent oxidoreductase (luciferase family)